MSARRIVYQTWDAKFGRPGPEHVRIETPSGKRFLWPAGTSTADLIYFPGGEPPSLNTEPLVVVEGEKSADAVGRAGYKAAGVVSGASTTPGPAVVSLLASYPTVLLWPDKDAPGRDLMRRLATELERAGLRRCRWVDPPDDLPDGGDAADLPAERVRALIDGARELVMLPEAHRPARGRDEPSPPAEDGDAPPARRPSAADLLVRLAEGFYQLYRDETGEPYALPIAGPPVARQFRGGRASLRAALAAAFATAYERVPPAQSLVDALAVLEGRALDAPVRPVALRAAWQDGRLFLDLADEANRVVEINADGWRVRPAAEAPIVWRRSETTGPLPAPVAGGSLDRLADFLNIDADHRAAALAAIASTLLALPTPIILLRGPAGAAKTTATKVLARLVDPGPAPVRAAPRDLEGWAVAAASCRIIGLDNVDVVPDWLSDALCRASTGEAVLRRRLYTNDELAVLAFRRLVVLTAIDPGALRGDLADRLLAVDLGPISEEARREDEELEAAFAAAHPQLLGAFLDLLVQVIRRRPSVQLARKPRMADFARVLAVVDGVLGTHGLERYLGSRADLQREAAEGDRIGAAILRFLDGRAAWAGTAEELLEALTPERPPRGWPETPRSLAARLRRIAQPLAAAGVGVDFAREGHDRRRIVRLERVGATSSFASASSAPSVNEPDSADANGFDADANADANEGHPTAIHAQADAKDDADAKSPPLSTVLPPSPAPPRAVETVLEEGRATPSFASAPSAGPRPPCFGDPARFRTHTPWHYHTAGRWRCRVCEAAEPDDLEAEEVLPW
jgi:hypothetical protein